MKDWKEDRLEELDKLTKSDIKDVDEVWLGQVQHALYAMSDTFYRFIIKDAGIISNKKLFKLAHKIATLQAELYQEIGREAYRKEQAAKARKESE